MRAMILRGAVVWIALMEASTLAAVRYVDVNSAAPTPPYTTWPSAAATIQDAIDAAQAGDEIVVTNGIYQTGGRAVYGVTTNRVTVDKAVTVQSVNGPTLTAIAGLTDRSTFPPTGIRCVYLTNGATLIGFTLTNGGTSRLGDIAREQSGGGVWCEDGSVTVSNCVFAGNFALLYGGGAFRGTLFSCVLTNNSASYGGGAASNTLINCMLTQNTSVFQNINYGGGAYYCTLSNCLITGNQSIAGGGNGAGAAFSTLINCVVTNNSAGDSGGGVFKGVANFSLISSNTARRDGGGADGSTLNNCRVSGNSANEGGGANLCTLNNCVAVNNRASFGGGGFNCALNNRTIVTNSGGGSYGGTLNNCVVYYNTGPNYTLDLLNYCCTRPMPAGAGNITNAPLFVNLAAGDFHLQTNSPCINAGSNAYVTNSTDLDANSRISGGTVDIGAYEFQTPSSLLSYAWLQKYGLPTDGSADYTDPDGDGLNNWQEWRAGTDPTNALSVLRLLKPVFDPAGVRVTWQSVANRTYFLERSTNLGVAPIFLTVGSNIVAHASGATFWDTNAVAVGPVFYRVGVAE